MQEHPVLGIFHKVSIEKIASDACLNSFQTPVYHFTESGLWTWNSTTSEYLESKQIQYLYIFLIFKSGLQSIHGCSN